MFKRLLIAAAGAVALSAAALPQVAFAQRMDHNGPGQMDRGGPDDIRIHGGHGHFGRGEGLRLREDQRNFGNIGGMGHHGPEDFRMAGGHRQFGTGEGFRFRVEHPRFSDREGFRFHPAPGHFGDGDRFRNRGRFDNRRDFSGREFRLGYRFGVIRPYPAYVGHPHRLVAFTAPYARSYVLNAGYGLPRAGCSTRRSVSLTPVGWHKIVTVRTCYVR